MEQAAESQAEAVRGAADLRDFQRVATRLQAELRQLQVGCIYRTNAPKPY